MKPAAKIRDWLLANDPALSRFRMAGRVTLTVIATVSCLALVHLAGVALPTIAYGLAIILSIEGGVAVRDRLPKEQLKTRLIGSVVSLGCVGLAAALEDWRYISDPMFIVVIALASIGRVYGPRGFAVGMFAFTSYFMGAYLRPSLSDLPLAALGPAVAVVTGHVVRTYILPDDWRREAARLRRRIPRLAPELERAATFQLAECLFAVSLVTGRPPDDPGTGSLVHFLLERPR